MSRMATAKAAVDFDFDKEFGFNDDEPANIKKIRLLGREWTVVCDLNSFAMAKIAGGDASGVADFLVNLLVEDEQEDFTKALANAKNMDGERLGKLLSRFIEVAGERPTERPSPSPRTAKRTTSSQRSGGN
jgi:hypothetical protein